ncbi:hypothetical protein ACVNHC_24380 [Pannonibacter sp. Q-1]
MNKDGPPHTPLTPLAERLHAKIAEERQALEQKILNELKTLAVSCLAGSKAELATIQTDMAAQVQSTRRTLAGLLRWPLWTALGLLLASLLLALLSSLGLWMLAKSQWEELNTIRAQVSDEQAALSDLMAQTGGVRILRAANGTFLVLPDSADQAKYTCDGKSCLKLSEKGS